MKKVNVLPPCQNNINNRRRITGHNTCVKGVINKKMRLSLTTDNLISSASSIEAQYWLIGSAILANDH